MRTIINFYVSKEDSIYTASAVGHFIVTQGETFEELLANIKEAVALYFEEENTDELGFDGEPSILLNYELTPATYAQN